MKKTVLTFGLISGAVVSATMLATIPFWDSISTNKAEVLGYASIVAASLVIFFGVRSYRENVTAGQITFVRAFAVGLLIALISSACYVGTWELVYYKFMPGFADKYAASMVKKARESGASQQKIEETQIEADKFKVMYQNPLNNVALTFMEVFPVELVVTIASAAILRKKKGVVPAASPALT